MTGERCEFTELLVDQCAHCRCPKAPMPADPFSDPAEREYGGRSPRGVYFTAAFPGRCSGCGARFEEFDQIRADGFGGYLAECCGGVE